MEKEIIIEQKIVNTLETNFMPYAMSVIVSRAIPEIDGLKPSHRKLLYTMYKMGLLNGNKTKSANVVGQTMKLNPHGDQAIYETLVRLTRGNLALLHPYIDSKGNFGKQYSKNMKAAASRYTEVKLEGICKELFSGLDKETVDFIDNYDGSMKEPVILPATFPSILANCNQGIAVGMASNICSFNLKELCETCIEYVRDKDVDIIDYLKGPDFPTGGQYILNKDALESIYRLGRGALRVRAKYKYDKKNSCIDVGEIPYTTTTEAIMDSIISLVKSGKIKEITDVRDETDLKGLKITIDIKKTTDVKTLMDKLFKVTPLEENFNCNFNILIDGYPKVMGIKEILESWTKFRINCIKRGLAYDINKKNEKLHLLLGLQIILLDIDKAIKIVRGTLKDAEVVPNLVKGFDIDEIQAEFIAEIKLRNLNKEHILKRIEEIESLMKEIKELRSILASRSKMNDLMCDQLSDIADKYGKERKTEIIDCEDVVEITEDHFIDDYNLKLFITKEGYIKKIPLTSLRSNPEQKVKPGDRIIKVLDTHNKAEILMFSNKSNVYKKFLYEINECKPSELGEYMANIGGLGDKEDIIFVMANGSYEGFMLFGFKNGKIAKIPVKSYETKTNRKKLANAYSDKDSLVFIDHLDKDVDMAAYSSIGKILVFNTLTINEKTTRSSQGIQVLKSSKGSTMKRLKILKTARLKNPNYYRTKNIPAVGAFELKEDSKAKQVTLDDIKK